MKFVGKFGRAITNENNDMEVSIIVSGVANKKAAKKAIEKVKDIALLDVDIAKHKDARSRDANAYMWVLLNKLAESISCRDLKPVTDVELYRKYVMDDGVHEDHTMSKDLARLVVPAWKARGLAWLVDLKDTVGDEVTLRLYLGSSSYNTQQMYKLIQSVIVDCKEMGIETKTPRQIEDLMNAWERQYEKRNPK